METEGGSPVKVYIYDLTKGLARTMSLPLLGKQLDGVWHTGIVVYGQEFFYGGEGIASCLPGGTILGQPDTIVDLGKTEVPESMFIEYLHDLSTGSYMAQRYHLLDHNCNTFSNDIACFLTGNNIPSYVTNLPQEVLSTPFGAMIKPFIDSMSVSPGGGQELFPAHSVGSGADSSATSSGQDSRGGKTGHTVAMSTSTVTSGTAASAPGRMPSATSASVNVSEKPITFNNSEILELYRTSKGGFFQTLISERRQVLDEVHEYLSSKECDWSLGRAHIEVFGQILGDPHIKEEHKDIVMELLQLSCMHGDVVNVLKHDRQSQNFIFGVIQTFDSYSIKSQISLVKALCNVSAHPAGISMLQDNNQIDKQASNSKAFTETCATSLLHEVEELNAVGAALAYNLTRSKVAEEQALELGIALVQLCLKQLPEDTTEWALCALWSCMQANAEVSGVANVMGLDLQGHRQAGKGKLKEMADNICKAFDNASS